MGKNILFITTANLTTNPRLLKELKLFSKQYATSFVGFYLGNWSDVIDEQHQRELPSVHFKYLSAVRKPLIMWFIASVIQLLSRKLYKYFPNNLYINSYAVDKRSWLLKRELKKRKADLVVAHNMGALYPAWWFAKKYKIPLTFDIEDYHPGEFIRVDAVNEKKRREFLMKKLLPQATALTSASPLIGIYTMKLIGGHPNHQVILNSFPQNEFSVPASQQINKSTNQLKLVWFSQKISFGRGLEQLFEAINLLIEEHNAITESLSLTIIGDLDPDFDAKILSKLINGTVGKHIHILAPMAQMELHRSLILYDVGLALEFNESDLNRQLCLTNKIITYAQAGLYILATDTPAQSEFIKNHSKFGHICGQSVGDIKNGLLLLINQKNEIIKDIYMRYENAKSFSWESESVKFIEKN